MTNISLDGNGIPVKVPAIEPRPAQAWFVTDEGTSTFPPLIQALDAGDRSPLGEWEYQSLNALTWPVGPPHSQYLEHVKNRALAERVLFLLL